MHFLNRQNHTRRFWILALAVVFAATMFTGCGKSSKLDADSLMAKLGESVDEENEGEEEDKKPEKKEAKKADSKTQRKPLKKDSESDQAEQNEESEADKTGKEDRFKKAKQDATPGSEFVGDWEGMTIVYDSRGTHKGKGVSDDWIYGTYARSYFDENGDLQFDMIGVMPVKELNFEINYAYYDPEFNEIEIGGLLCGGDFDALVEAPDAGGLLTFTGKTTGDIKQSYAVYLKKLDSEWERSDAPQIGDKEYNIYIINNLPNMQGMTLEERVKCYQEVGVDVDLSDFLRPQ